MEVIREMIGKLRVNYDDTGHCVAVQETRGKAVAMDCPLLGKGEEFSPADLVGAGLAGCTLMSVGTRAKEENLDISGSFADVKIFMTDKPVERIGKIDIILNMPKDFSEETRHVLEEAASKCAVKASLHPDIKISTGFKYPGN